jgi:DHA2 family multidrug resistance protein
LSGAVRSSATAASPSGAGLPTALTGGALLLAGFVLAMSNFMVVLDTSIANVSIPNIAGGLAVSSNEGTWVITSYQVAEAITVPLTGWLAQRFGAVKVYVTGIALFGLFSALCGLAPSLSVLVFCRIMQGLAGGPIMPMSQTLLLRVFPPQQAPQAIGIWSMTTVVGPIAGPLLGGFLSDGFGWPWVFYVNVPVAIFCAVFAWRILAKHENAIRKLPIDGVGLGLLVVFVGAMQIALDKGRELDWLNSPTIVGLMITAAIGFVCFLIWELTAENPIVNLRVFRHRAFATATVTMALTFGSFFAGIVIIPLWLQTNMGYTATWAGYATAFNGVLAVVMSPIVAQLVRKFDPRALVCFGVSWLACVMLWRTTFASNISFGLMIWPQLAQGFAMPFFFIPLMALGTGALAPDEVASGAGLINFMRTTAGAFGTSIATTVWEDGAARAHANLAGEVNNPSTVLNQIGALGLSSGQALQQLDMLVQSQAVMLATNRIFVSIAAMMLIAAASIWLAPKPKGPLQAVVSEH